MQRTDLPGTENAGKETGTGVTNSLMTVRSCTEKENFRAIQDSGWTTGNSTDTMPDPEEFDIRGV
jgi:hypothetical protein